MPLIIKNINIDIAKKKALKILNEFNLAERQDYFPNDLSGGEQQRIAIARAFLKNSPFLLLDEATSSLDSRSEKKIQTSLANLMKNKTSLVIAHRLSTIIDANKIILLHNGKVVEIDNHKNLLKKSKIYKNLYELQFKKK